MGERIEWLGVGSTGAEGVLVTDAARCACLYIWVMDIVSW